MAEKGWTAQVAAAAGIAAGTGAAQLGLGYGLGVVEWPAVPADDSVWLGSLGWATWIAASSTVFGAVIAARLGRAVGGPWRSALAASAAVGALLTVALIALPARAAVRTETFSPQTIAAGYAVIGVLLGLVIAYWAVVSRPVAANLIATAAWLWSLAVAAVLTTIIGNRPSATYLSSWQFFSPDNADDQYGIIFWPSALLTLLAAFALGILGTLPAIRRGDLSVGAASSGAVGPLLVAAAFFVLAPQLTGTPGPLQSAYLIAPYAVLAGLAGSALAIGLSQRQARGRADAPRPAAGSGNVTPHPAAGSHDVTPRPAAGSGNVAPRPDAEPTGSRRKSARTSSREGAEQAKPATRTGSAEPATSPGSASAGQSPARLGVKSARGAAVPGRSGSPAADQAELTSKSDHAGAASAATAEPRPRKSFMDRFRRKDKGQATDEQPATVTGRAKAAVSSAPAAAGSPSPASVPPAGSAIPAARGKSPAARPPAARSGAPSVDGGARPAASAAPGRSDTRTDTRPAGPGSSDTRPAASGGSDSRSAAPGRSDSRSAAPGRSDSRSAAPGRSDSRSPASAEPGRSEARSTVAPPPETPPIAKINGPRSGEKPSAPGKAAARPSGNPTPGPANAVSSDKTPPARKTPAKSTKSTPAKATAPRQATPGRPAGAKSTASSPDDGSLWSDDTAELPVHDPKRRGEDG